MMVRPLQDRGRANRRAIEDSGRGDQLHAHTATAARGGRVRLKLAYRTVRGNALSLMLLSSNSYSSYCRHILREEFAIVTPLWGGSGTGSSYYNQLTKL